MSKYCFRCGKDFNFKSQVLRHLNRRFLCQSIYLDVTQSEVKSNYDKLLDDFIRAKDFQKEILHKQTQTDEIQTHQQTHEIQIKCELCDTVFTHKNSYYRHKKYYCKEKNDSSDVNNHVIENKDEIIASLIELLKQKGVDSSHILNNSGIIGGENNTINNNITINGFGNEDLSMITDTVMKELASKYTEAINEMFRIVHLETPENMNLELLSINNQYMKVYNDEIGDWQTAKTNKVFDTITVKYGNMIYEFIDKNAKEMKKCIGVNRAHNFLSDIVEEDIENRKKTKIRDNMKIDLVNKQIKK